MINHVNLADGHGHVYCCLRNRVVKLETSQKERYCKNCSMWNGDAGGAGVECLWDDLREPMLGTVVVKDAWTEWDSNQQRRVRIS